MTLRHATVAFTLVGLMLYTVSLLPAEAELLNPESVPDVDAWQAPENELPEYEIYELPSAAEAQPQLLIYRDALPISFAPGGCGGLRPIEWLMPELLASANGVSLQSESIKPNIQEVQL